MQDSPRVFAPPSQKLQATTKKNGETTGADFSERETRVRVARFSAGSGPHMQTHVMTMPHVHTYVAACIMRNTHMCAVQQ